MRIILAISLFLFVLGVRAQPLDSASVPENINVYFYDMFPFAENAVWKKDTQSYIASFSYSDMQITASYDLEEAWEFTEWIIPSEHCLLAIRTYCQEKYGKKFRIEKFLLLEDPEGKKYRTMVYLKKKKSTETIDFTLEGVLIR
jgi:hypothetical protein